MNRIDELLKLKELLDSGIITENDFEKKKVELFSDIKTENKNSDSIKKKEIIIGEGEKECLSCKCIIEKESESCNFCDYDFINNKYSENSKNPFKNNNNFKKYISIFMTIIIFIFFGIFFILFFKNSSTNNPEIKNSISTKVESANSIQGNSEKLKIHDTIILNSINIKKYAGSWRTNNGEWVKISSNGEINIDSGACGINLICKLNNDELKLILKDMYFKYGSGYEKYYSKEVGRCYSKENKLYLDITEIEISSALGSSAGVLMNESEFQKTVDENLEE